MAMEMLQSGQLGAISASAGTTTILLGEIPMRESQGSYNLDRVSVTVPSTVTGNAAATARVRIMRAGSQSPDSSTYAASLSMASGTNFAGETATSVPVLDTPQILAGDVLEFQWVQTGGGLALPAGTVVKAEIS